MKLELSKTEVAAVVDYTVRGFNGKIRSDAKGTVNTFPALTDFNTGGIEMANQSLPDNFTKYKQSDISQFWLLVQIRSAAECWEWQGTRGGKGYGQLRVHGRRSPVYAHRLSFYLANGYEAQINVLHSCDNPPCVNPAHLREGTQRENIQEAIAKGRITPGAHMRAKTHCVHGHAYTPENTRWRKNGHRYCGICHSSQVNARK